MTFDALSEINYLAAAVAAVAYGALGSIWYATPVFGKAWQTAVGLTDEQARSGQGMLIVQTLIGYFLAAVTLAAIARTVGTTELMDGVVLGLFVGVGVVATGIWINNAYQRGSTALLWINAVYGLIGYLIMAVIVTMWD
jgi:hypothetical protein